MATQALCVRNTGLWGAAGHLLADLGLAYTLHTGVRHCRGSVGSQIPDALQLEVFGTRRQSSGAPGCIT